VAAMHPDTANIRSHLENFIKYSFPPDGTLHVTNNEPYLHERKCIT